MMKIQATGWLERFLQVQMEGLTGHIEEAGYPFDEQWWGIENRRTADGNNPGWWTYEQTAYWIDGALRCSIVLGLEEEIKKLSNIIYSVLANPDKEGYLGPKFSSFPYGYDDWPHVVFFRACIALYDYNHDEKILLAIKRHYLGCKDKSFDWERDVLNVEIMLLVHERNACQALVDLAEKCYDCYNLKCETDLCDRVALSDKKPYGHGVSYNEYSKLGALLYRVTGKQKYLAASVNAYKKIDKFFMLPGGCHCSNEFLISDHFMQSTETCDVTDYTWALSYLLSATKNGEYADKIERCVFNAGIGAVTEDFKALQYFSCANQLIADSSSNHNVFFRGDTWMAYRPNPGTECCPGNVNRFMPNYVLNTWKTDETGVACNLFGPTTYYTEWKGGKIKIEENTAYPFKEEITFFVECEKEFPLKLRIPRWAVSYIITMDDMPVDTTPVQGFITLNILKNSKIVLKLASKIEKIESYDGVYFKKGVLTYSLGGKDKRTIVETNERSSKDFPAYDMVADFEWRYCVKEDCDPLFIEGDATWFDCGENLPKLEITAYSLPGWEYEKKSIIQRLENAYGRRNYLLERDCILTPTFNFSLCPDAEKKRIILLPYAATKMRLTVFPDYSKRL